MIQINGHTILEKLGEGPRSQIYKGYRDDQPHRLLCIKTFKAFQITKAEKKYYLQKIEHLKILNDLHFLIPLTFKSSDDSWFITRDYFEGVTLDKYLLENKISDLNHFFILARKLCELVDVVHQAGIIHGSLKPRNILINPKGQEVRVVDFISPLDVRNISHFIYDQDFVHTTLAYTSPEETGRINYRVDFTTDIYSLGIVFYEMLTGLLPYSSEDPLEMIHYHMAKVPTSISEINKNVPKAISDIIAKMMSKRPEQRYQTANGVSLDFVKFQNKLEEGLSAEVISFYLGEKDHHTRIKFISKMVGRDREAQKILDCYDHVANGHFQSMFISGFSGIGKTRLIQELQRPIIGRRGYFTSGKFDVYQKNIPYSSLLQAFRNLVRTFLTESDSRVVLWKEKILNAVGDQGQVLIEVIPELEILIGSQPVLDALPPVEARNRFNRVFENFLKAVASDENPLVLFIDDLQWCDLASFEFLTNVFNSSKENNFLFFIGAYRHNEVDNDHPLVQLLNKIKTANIPIEEVHLGPISEAACNEMISYILDVPPNQTLKLATFLNQLTDGNPLFISESLSYLYNEKLIRFKESTNEWIWDLEDINQSKMPTTIVALFSSKLKKLDPSVIDIMNYCACMGNNFAPDDLAHIMKIELIELFEKLRPALGMSLIIENKNYLQFVHDKVQEATLDGITPELREKIHWQIGQYMFEENHHDFLQFSVENIFSMASHFNIAAEIAEKCQHVIHEDQSFLICKVNYHAGNSALHSLATFAANDYFNRSLKLLPKNAWDDHYALTYSLHIKLAKTELMVGRYINSEKLLSDLLHNAKSDLDKIEALSEQTTSLSSIGNFIKAIETANRGLAFFEMDIPVDNQIARNKCETIMDLIHGKNEDVWSKILNMPFSDDRKSKVELAFYSELIPDLYMSGMPDQLYLSAAQSTRNCLAGGMNESVIYSFSIMGLNLGEKEQFEMAFKYEDLARNMVEKYPNTFGSTRGINGVVWCNMHSRSTPDQIIAYCLKGIQSGKNCGDLYNAGLCFGPLMWNMQVLGSDFKKSEMMASDCLKFSEKFDLNFSVGLAESVIAGWIEPMRSGNISIDMSEKIKKWKSENHIASIGSYFMHIGLSCYYLREFHKAQDYFCEVEKYISGMTDNVLKRQWFIFKILNNIELFFEGTSEDKVLELPQINRDIEIVLKKVAKWVELGPLLKPFYCYLIAKTQQLNAGLDLSMKFYFEAISEAQKLGYIFFEGYINESLGIELVKRQWSSSHLFIKEAGSLYTKCFAETKLKTLKEKFPEIRDWPGSQDVASDDSLTLFEEMPRVTPRFDLEYFLKSSQAMATEMNVDILVKKIIDIVIESSDAQLGLLAILKNDKLVIMAKKDLKMGGLNEQTDLLLEDDPDISVAIIRYVYRSLQNVVLDNASLEGDFVNDSDVQRLKLKSILCIPLLSQSKLMGVVYLENRLLPAVFQSNQIKLTKSLSSQAAIALDHALLMKNMKLAKDEIKKSLEEKEILLKEINHRVKNNLQIIWSLFNLQMRKVKDQETIEIFKEAQNRIYSISLIHQQLFQSNSYGKIVFVEYLNGLVSNMIQSYGLSTTGHNSIQLSLNVEEIEISLELAVPLGIIINEIVTNSLKHAFLNFDIPKIISISLIKRNNEKNEIELIISDNGVGLPADFDREKKEGIGMNLIKNLASQIEAQFSYTSKNGVKYNFIIPLNREGV
jgi:predicted ATPase/two-component sensor histidine kinase